MPANQGTNPKPIEPRSEETLYRNLFILIPVLTFLIYLGIFGHHYISFDDDWYIYDSPFVSGFTWDKAGELLTQPYEGQYSPLPQFYLAALYKLGGGKPFLMKLGALLIHILNSILVFRLIYKLIKDYRGAFFVAALFAMHPMQVESVAWLTAIFKISACFSLAAMLLYLKFLETRKPIYYTSILLLFVLSFMTKEQAILLPVSLVLIDYMRGRRLLSKQVIVEKIPLFLMSLVFGLITLKVVASGGHVSAQTTKFGHTIYLVSLAIGSYFQKLLAPVDLSFAYTYPILTKGFQLQYAVIPIIVIAGAIVVFVAARKNRVALFGVLFWVVNLSLSLAFIVVALRDSFIADRYIYLACVGFFLALYSLLRRLIEAKSRAKRIVHYAAAGYLVFLMSVTYGRTAVFDNPETVWTDAINKNPNDFFARYNRASFYRDVMEYEKAIRDYGAAIELNKNFALAYYELGRIYLEAGDMNTALALTNGAIETYRSTRRAWRTPEYLDAYNNRAVIYAAMNQFDRALADLDLVLANEPGRVDALANRLLVLVNVGDYSRGLQDVELLLRNNPDDPSALHLAGLCYGGLGDMTNALSSFDRAIALAPRQGAYWLSRSRAYYSMQDRAKALSDAVQAQQLGASVDTEYMSSLTN
jgi:tetratricopeptide (TPR) repeat protein